MGAGLELLGDLVTGDLVTGAGFFQEIRCAASAAACAVSALALDAVQWPDSLSGGFGGI